MSSDNLLVSSADFTRNWKPPSIESDRNGGADGSSNIGHCIIRPIPAAAIRSTSSGSQARHRCST
jgi:hypothetical protein